MKTKDITKIAILSTMVFVSQLVMSPLLNINIVTFLFIVFLYRYGLKSTLLISIIFTTLMGLFYGFGLWVFGYYWIYSFIILLVYLLKPVIQQNIYFLSLLGLCLGFLFGFLFSIQDAFFTQVSFYVYWLRGLPYDLIHGLSNCLSIYFMFRITLDFLKKVDLAL